MMMAAPAQPMHQMGAPGCGAPYGMAGYGGYGGGGYSGMAVAGSAAAGFVGGMMVSEAMDAGEMPRRDRRRTHAKLWRCGCRVLLGRRRPARAACTVGSRCRPKLHLPSLGSACARCTGHHHQHGHSDAGYYGGGGDYGGGGGYGGGGYEGGGYDSGGGGDFAADS
eukprot:7381505-Prymnesium_polylepis.1